MNRYVSECLHCGRYVRTDKRCWCKVIDRIENIAGIIMAIVLLAWVAYK